MYECRSLAVLSLSRQIAQFSLQALWSDVLTGSRVTFQLTKERRRSHCRWVVVDGAIP